MVNTVDITLNGNTYPASYNPDTGQWEARIPAPATTSATLPGGFYPISIFAVSDVGYDFASTADPEWAETLRLVVTENVQPAILVLYPAEGSFLSTARPEIALELREELDGSGIDLTSFVMTLDGTDHTYTADGMVVASAGNGYSITYIPPEGLADGPHSLEINVRDNDGNAAEPMELSFVTDTVAPTLAVVAPEPGKMTALESAIIRGVIMDDTSPVRAWVILNGAWVGELVIRAGGEYSLAIPLLIMQNVFTVFARDAAGNIAKISQVITRTFDFWVITDRTQADLARAQTLHRRVWQTLTPAEKAEYLGGMRGAYGITDLNRVETDVRWLRDYLAELGFRIPANPKEDWVRQDIPMPADMARYLAQINLFTEYFAPRLAALPLPATMERLTIAGANSIEQYLLAVLDAIGQLRSSVMFYAGDLYAGEI